MDKSVYSNSFYGQTQYHQQVQAIQRGYFDIFLNEYAQNTAAGVCAGLLFATFLTGRKSLSKLVPLYAGVGGGIALNRCAAKFNRLKANEIRIEQDFQSVEAG